MAAAEAAKDGYLNQSYYGPSIPSQQPIRPKPTSIFKDCTPYSLLCHAFKILTIILIVIGSVVLVVWLVLQPSALKVVVLSATLTRFNLTSTPTPTLAYNLSAVLTVRNPNKRVGVFYKHVQASAFYADAHLGDIVLPLFHQPKENTTTFDLTFAGPPVPATAAVNGTYAREKGEGWFFLTIKFYTKVRLRMFIVNTVEYTPEGDCSLRLPAPMNATSVKEGFQTTACHVDEFS